MSVGTSRATRRLKLLGSLRSEHVTVPPLVATSLITIRVVVSSSFGGERYRHPRRTTPPISRTLSNARACRFTSCPIGQFIGRFFFARKPLKHECFARRPPETP